jgi:hypothetical protein
VVIAAGGGFNDDEDDEPTNKSLSQKDPFPLLVPAEVEIEPDTGLRLADVDEDGREIVGCSRPSKAVDDLSGIGCNGAPVCLDELDIDVDVEVDPEVNCSQLPKPENCSFSLSSFKRLSSANWACFWAIVMFFVDDPDPDPDPPRRSEKASPLLVCTGLLAGLGRVGAKGVVVRGVVALELEL